MKKLFLLCFMLVASVAFGDDEAYSVKFEQAGSHAKIYLNNPKRLNLALMVTYDWKTWGFLGSTTNATQTFYHCHTMTLNPQAFYRAKLWSGPAIPPIPPCQ